MKLAVPVVPTVLLFLCAALAILLVAEINRPVKSPRIPEATAPIPDGEPPRGHSAFVAPAQEEFSEIGARPIFAVARRPPPPVPPPAPTPVAVPPPPPPAPPPAAAKTITVLGIVGAPPTRIALLRPPNAPTALSVIEGESVAGWQVVRILADRVVLRWNATEEEISFPRSDEKAGMPAPAPVRPPQVNGRRP